MLGASPSGNITAPAEAVAGIAVSATALLPPTAVSAPTSTITLLGPKQDECSDPRAGNEDRAGVLPWATFLQVPSTKSQSRVTQGITSPRRARVGWLYVRLCLPF